MSTAGAGSAAAMGADTDAPELPPLQPPLPPLLPLPLLPVAVDGWESAESGLPLAPRPCTDAAGDAHGCHDAVVATC